jgi:hypothetical protein
MRKILFATAVIAIGLSARAQKIVNDANAEKRNVSGFHAISVGGGIDLYLSQGEEGVAVSASETKYRDQIRTEVVNGVLKISYDYKNKLGWSITSGKMKLKAYVSAKTLDKLHAGGGSDVSVDGTLKSTSLDIHISGGSDFVGKIEATDLKAECSGGSDMRISGTAKNLAIDASGGSDVKGFDLNVESCYAEASGGSDIQISASKELNVNTSGGSDVHYKGSAVIKDIKTSGGGSVKKVSK